MISSIPYTLEAGDGIVSWQLSFAELAMRGGWGIGTGMPNFQVAGHLTVSTSPNHVAIIIQGISVSQLEIITRIENLLNRYMNG